MIPARKHPTFNRWFSSYARTKLRGAFEAVRAEGVSALRDTVRESPAVVVLNHTSWWDPLLILHLSEHVLRADGFAMMDAANLTRLPFFGLVGAFGVDRASPSDGASVLRYAAKLLDRPGRVVWVFPQGSERPSTERPLNFKPGSAELARLARCPTVPVGVRYEWRGAERPEAILSVGDPIAPERDVKAGRAAHERAVTERLDRVDRALIDGAVARWEPLLTHPPEVMGEWATRALAWMTRPRG